MTLKPSYNNNKEIVEIGVDEVGRGPMFGRVYCAAVILPQDNFKHELMKDSKKFSSERKIQKIATLYYFYTTWCPLSKKANPEWEALQTKTNGVVKDVNIVFKEVDCDQDAALADKFNVTGYPTIKLVYNGTTYEYDAKPNRDTLLQFLNSVL